MGGVCCSDSGTVPSVAGDSGPLPVQAAPLIEERTQDHEEHQSKAKAKPKKKSDPAKAREKKAQPVAAALKEVRTLHKNALEDKFAKLSKEYECQKNIWQIMVQRQGAPYKSVVDKVKVRMTTVLSLGTRELVELLTNLEEILKLGSQVDAVLSSPMTTLIEELIKGARAAPHRLRLLQILERREQDIKNGATLEKLPASEIDALVSSCQMEQKLEGRLRPMLGAPPGRMAGA